MGEHKSPQVILTGIRRGGETELRGNTATGTIECRIRAKGTPSFAGSYDLTKKGGVQYRSTVSE